MYLSTYEERENGSLFEENYDGRNLSKLNLCDEGRRIKFGSGLLSYCIPFSPILLYAPILGSFILSSPLFPSSLLFSHRTYQGSRVIPFVSPE